MNSIHAAWQSYRQMVVPENAGPVQVRESQLAFYAGAGVMFDIMIRTAGMSDAAAEAVITSIGEELTEFHNQVQSEKYHA